MKKFVFLVAVLLAIAFGLFVVSSETINTSTSLEDQDPEQRIKAVSNIIEHHTTHLPSSIIDANYLEHKKGSGSLGPTDYQFYARLQVQRNDVSHWISGLEKPFNNTTFYSAPETDVQWWLAEQRFKSLELYETKKYFGRYNGWLAVDKSTGFIYVYTFTQ